MEGKREGLTVRPLAAGDWTEWLPLWRGYLKFYRAEVAADVTAETFARLTDVSEPMEGALAVLDGAVVGLAHLIKHRSTWTRGDYLYLQDLFTADSVRGRGVGRALIAHAYARAEAMGCSRVHWLTHETNLQAMRLYDAVAERSGFVQYRKLL